MKPLPERRPLSRIRDGRRNEYTAGRTGDGTPQIPLDEGLDLRQFDRLVLADDRRGKIAR